MIISLPFLSVNKLYKSSNNVNQWGVQRIIILICGSIFLAFPAWGETVKTILQRKKEKQFLEIGKKL